MTKTITRRTHARTVHRPNHKIARDVDHIIKKAMARTAAYGLKRKVKNFITDSLENAKYKSANLHRGVGRYTHRKPYTTLGLAMLTGAALALVFKKTLDNNHRRSFFRR